MAERFVIERLVRRSGQRPTWRKLDLGSFENKEAAVDRMAGLIVRGSLRQYRARKVRVSDRPKPEPEPIRVAHNTRRPRPGFCEQCQRRYDDRLFSIAEYLRVNRAGIEARGHGEAAERAAYEAHLARDGFENCERPGCNKAVKVAADG